MSTVLGKSAGNSTPPFSPADFLLFLDLKVESIRSATAAAPPPVFTHTGSNLDLFEICPPDEVSKIIKASAAKSCDLDPAPTFLVKEFLDELLPHLTRLCNVSIQSGCLPSSQKTAMVMPRLKKSGLDPAKMKKLQANIEPSIHVQGHREVDPSSAHSIPDGKWLVSKISIRLP